MSDLSKYAVMTGILLISAYISAAPVSGSVLSLEQAIITALDNNPSLQIMHERIAQAEARVGEAIARFYPHVQARLSYEHSDNPSRAFGMIISQRRLD
ncbi:MAG: TolC family protein, partial [Gammaproteobacteria bacterium]